MVLESRFKTTESTRKMPNTMLVAQVSTSPVLEPNAVFPPAPPKALASPPPRPFWIRISRIRNTLTMMNSVMVRYIRKPIGSLRSLFVESLLGRGRDGEEALGLERRAADQAAVHVVAPQQAAGVL